jgi:ferritin-like metal-binding protein YciE
MTRSEQKVVHYLNEAHATETGLVRELQAQISMTPRGSYRTALDKHLGETRRHAELVEARLRELQGGRNPIQVAMGVAQSVAGQAVAVARAPVALVRGSGGEEKVLKNAKESCAAEALEIATYTALERLATTVGDPKTAKLAARIRADEERMLERVLGELPALTDAVVAAEVHGDPSSDVASTGAAETARTAGARAKRTTRQARRAPGVARAQGRARGAVAGAGDLAIARYDALNADEIVGRLAELSQVELTKIDTYERRHESRATVLTRIESLRADEPWPGYDDQTASDIEKALSAAGEERARSVRAYERAHKDRAGVLQATDRELSNA